MIRGRFRVRGDTLEVMPAYEETVFRVEYFGDHVERITEMNPVTGEVLSELPELWVYPASHYVATEERRQEAIIAIEAELADRLRWFEERGKLLEAQRLRMRTFHDLEMMRGSATATESRTTRVIWTGASRGGAIHVARLLP